MKPSPSYYRYNIPQAKNKEYDFRTLCLARYSFMRREGLTYQQISDITGRSSARIIELLRSYNRSGIRPFKEKRDVYAEFKEHYDSVMVGDRGKF